MAFTEDLDVFLGDFALPVAWGNKRGVGILDMPTEIVADGQVMTTDYQLTCKSSDFATIPYGATVTVDGTAYTARSEPHLIDDGRFCIVMLTRT